MARINGGIIGPDNIPSGPLGSASGVWKLSDAFNYQKEGLWPVVTGITYPVANSLRFNSGSSDYLNRTLGTATNRKIWTFSTWIKRSKITSTNHIFSASVNTSTYPALEIVFNSSGVFLLSEYNGSGYNIQLNTNRLFRDVSAWYHIVVAVDTTQATASDRVKIYVNGVQETSFSTANYYSLNADPAINNASIHTIGKHPFASESADLDALLSHFHFIDGQQLAPTDFGETDSVSGNWKAKAYSGSYGTNGFFLEFQNSGALGTDSSGNANNFTVNNLTSVDQSTDTPTTNFATFNPLFSPAPSNVSTFSEGNLKVVTNSTSQNSDGLSTLGVSQGKWYGEFKLIAEATGESVCGIKTNIENPTTNGLHGTGGFSVASNGDSFNNGSSQGAGNFSASYTTNDIISVALDLDNNKVYFAKNGSWTNGTGSWSESSPTGYFSVTSGQTYFMGVGDKSTSQSSTWNANFGSPMYSANGYADGNGFGDFSYAVPTGYYALNTQNLNVQG